MRHEATDRRQIEKLDSDVAADKEMLADELTGNFASMGEAFETYAEFASANKSIDLYNAAQGSTSKISRR